MMRRLVAGVFGLGDLGADRCRTIGLAVVRMGGMDIGDGRGRHTGSRRQRNKRRRLANTVRRQQNDLQEMHPEENPGGTAKTRRPASHARNVISAQQGENCLLGGDT